MLYVVLLVVAGIAVIVALITFFINEISRVTDVKILRCSSEYRSKMDKKIYPCGRLKIKESDRILLVRVNSKDNASPYMSRMQDNLIYPVGVPAIYVKNKMGIFGAPISNVGIFYIKQYKTYNCDFLLLEASKRDIMMYNDVEVSVKRCNIIMQSKTLEDLTTCKKLSSEQKNIIKIWCNQMTKTV